MSKFSVGEVVVIVSSGKGGDLIPYIGEDIIIKAVNPFASEYSEDHYSTEPSHDYEAIWGKHLRKKQPPHELSSWEEIEKLTQWHPERIEV